MSLITPVIIPAENCDWADPSKRDRSSPSAAFHEALRLGRNVFLTGQAGTGKSYLLEEAITLAPFDVDITAPTGVAALNVGGRTVHRWAGMLLGPEPGQSDDHYWRDLQRQPYPSLAAGWRRIQTCECLVIDEISMLNGRTFTFLEYMFRTLRESKEPWGGCQIIVTGDFLQLPPVRKDDTLPYDWCFATPAWKASHFEMIQLTKVRRQGEPAFVSALGAMRIGEIEGANAILLNSCVSNHPDPSIPRLLTHNAQVDHWNQLMLEDLPGDMWVHEAIQSGSDNGIKFLEKNLLCPMTLELKVGARVMTLINDHGERFVNGSTGYVRGFDGGDIWIGLDDGGVVGVGINRYSSGGKHRKKPVEGQVEEGDPREGVIKQYPVRLAYAMTIHKCVDANTRVLLDSGSVMPISNLRQADSITLGGRVIAIEKSDRRAFKIVTKMGYEIVASWEHAWETDLGWIETSHLADRQCAIALDFKKVDYCGVRDDYSWWLGAMVGNGTYNDSKEGGFHFSTTSKTLGNKWSKIALSIGFAKANWRSDGRGLHATSVGLRKRMQNDGLEYLKGPKKRIPQIIWERGYCSWVSFLQGLFDTDGSVGKSFVVLTTVSKDMSRDVQDMLLLCGIVSKRNSFPGVKDRYWQVRINAEFIRQFEARIGFSEKSKRDKLFKCRPNRIIVKFNGYDPVVSITSLGKSVPMVDIEVAPPHRVGFGPFVGHNSQGMTLNSAYVDIRSAREPGQAYVALSRVKTAAGLKLKAFPNFACVSNDALKFYQTPKS